jgi:hypothetical protein
MGGRKGYFGCIHDTMGWFMIDWTRDSRRSGDLCMVLYCF